MDGAGARFTAVQKSGSNQFHGAYMSIPVTRFLDAKNSLIPASTNSAAARNQFGGVLSGPLSANRLSS